MLAFGACTLQPIVHRSTDVHAHKRLLGLAVGASVDGKFSLVSQCIIADARINATVSLSINDLLTDALTTVAPVLALVTETVSNVDNLAEDLVVDTLEGAFVTIEATLATVVSDLAGLTGKVVKRSIVNSNKRALTNEEVAQTLANLLNGVAGGKYW